MLAGDRDGSTTSRALGVAAAIALGVGVAACGSGGDDDAAPLETAGATTTEDTGLPSCRDVDRAVVFSVFGAATNGADGEVDRWVADEDAEPTPRPQAAEVVSAYREVGYEIVYLADLPSETHIGDQPVVDAVTVWLGLNDFPVGDGVRVWAPPGDGSADAQVALIEELARMDAAGTEIDAGYAGDEDAVFPLVSGGVPRDRVYLLGDQTSGSAVSSTPLPDSQLAAHVAEIQALDPVCER
ncbi:MAG TPA: hypothetical protein VIL36_13570 [Acidimicrobiales bacterium]